MISLTTPSRHHALHDGRFSSAVVLAAAALLSAGLAPVLAAEPTSFAPDAAPSASILIISLDTLGTDQTDDDILLDGSLFSVRIDDGDRAFDASLDVVASGPTPAPGGLLDTAMLASGWYWVEAVSPAGYLGPPPIFLELNTDGTKTCVWEASGLAECQSNDAGAEGLSWTMVLVRSAPSATPTATPTAAPTAAPSDPTSAPTSAPTGEVQEATARPAVTLPPTDRVGPGREPPVAAAAVWVVFLLLSISAVVARTVRSTRAAQVRRSGPRLD